MFEQPCKRADNLIHRCKWEAQYDYEGPSAALQDQIEFAYDIEPWLAELGRERKTYAGSLCLTCGRFAKRIDTTSDIS